MVCDFLKKVIGLQYTKKGIIGFFNKQSCVIDKLTYDVMRNENNLSLIQKLIVNGDEKRQTLEEANGDLDSLEIRHIQHKSHNVHINTLRKDSHYFKVDDALSYKMLRCPKGTYKSSNYRANIGFRDDFYLGESLVSVDLFYKTMGYVPKVTQNVITFSHLCYLIKKHDALRESKKITRDDEIFFQSFMQKAIAILKKYKYNIKNEKDILDYCDEEKNIEVEWPERKCMPNFLENAPISCNWYESIFFCNTLSEMCGFSKAYAIGNIKVQEFVEALKNILTYWRDRKKEETIVKTKFFTINDNGEISICVDSKKFVGFMNIHDNIPIENNAFTHLCSTIAYQELKKLADDIDCDGLDDFLSKIHIASIINSADVILLKDSNGFRLPIESEWEYAALANSTKEYVGTDLVINLKDFVFTIHEQTYDLHDGWQENIESQKMVNNLFYGHHHLDYIPMRTYTKISEYKNLKALVGKTKKPNAWGFYDMMGLCYEWCYDVFDIGIDVESVGPWNEAMLKENGIIEDVKDLSTIGLEKTISNLKKQNEDFIFYDPYVDQYACLCVNETIPYIRKTYETKSEKKSFTSYKQLKPIYQNNISLLFEHMLILHQLRINNYSLRDRNVFLKGLYGLGGYSSTRMVKISKIEANIIQEKHKDIEIKKGYVEQVLRDDGDVRIPSIYGEYFYIEGKDELIKEYGKLKDMKVSNRTLDMQHIPYKTCRKTSYYGSNIGIRLARGVKARTLI